MTNIEKARYIISMATVANVSINLWDAIFKYPCITGEECKELASTSIYSYSEIRRVFPVEKSK